MRGHRGPEPGTSKMLKKRMTPQLLYDLGVFSELPFEDDNTRHYRIWGYHDHTVFQNKDMGHISITPKDDGFSLTRVLVHADAICHITKVQVKTSGEYQDPISWTVENMFTDTAGCIRDELSMKREFSVNGDKIIENLNKGNRITRHSGNIMVDWSLLIFADKVKMHWQGDFMDMMMLHKPNQHVIENGSAKLNGKKLNIISHYGGAMASRDYYVDENGLVVLMLQDQVAWILDNNAPCATEQLIEDLTTMGVHYEY